MIEYTYVVHSVNAAEKRLLLRFESTGKPPIFKPLITEDFSAANIDTLAESLEESVITLWEKMETIPDQSGLIGNVGSRVYKSTIEAAKPAFNENIEMLEEVVVETATEINVSWNVVPLSAAEIEQKLLDRRETVRTSLKASRTIEVNTSINNIQVASPEDRENITGTVQNWEAIAIGTPPLVNWIGADNTIVTVSKSDLEFVIATYIARKSQAFEKYATLITQLNESSDPETIIWS